MLYYGHPKTETNGGEKMQVNILRAKMVEAGYTQRSLAEKLNISENTLSNKLKGRSAFDVNEVRDICAVLGIENDKEKAYIFLS